MIGFFLFYNDHKLKPGPGQNVIKASITAGIVEAACVSLQASKPRDWSDDPALPRSGHFVPPSIDPHFRWIDVAAVDVGFPARV